MSTLTRHAFDSACANLDRFMIGHAAKFRRIHGFSYEESPNAPETFEALKNEYRHSRRYMKPFRVFDGASDDCVYSREGNYAFRFWHDLTHVLADADLTFHGEVKAIMHQLPVVIGQFGADSLEVKIFEADTLGQLGYFHATGAHVEDQRDFVWRIVSGATLLPAA